MAKDTKTVEEQIADLKKYQGDINKAFEEEIRILKEGQDETNERLSGLDEKVNGNLKDLVDVNNSVRRELTKFTDYFLEERRESERRESEAKERDAQARREAEEREASARKRADEIKRETRNQMFKLLGSGGIIYMVVNAIIQALLK